MGRIMTQKASLVRPSENGIRAKDLASLLPFFKEGRQGNLFPAAVRTFPDFMAINGHHRLFLADLFDVEIGMFGVEREYDLMHISDFPGWDGAYLWEQNIRIAFLYNDVPGRVGAMEKRGILTFEDLRLGYGARDAGDLEKYLRWQCPDELAKGYEALRAVS